MIRRGNPSVRFVLLDKIARTRQRRPTTGTWAAPRPYGRGGEVDAKHRQSCDVLAVAAASEHQRWEGDSAAALRKWIAKYGELQIDNPKN
jgi:hypothetical protein